MIERDTLDTLALARDYLDSLMVESYEVQGDWLVQTADGCTCAGDLSGYGHQPGCGYLPLTSDPMIVALHSIAPVIRVRLQRQIDLDNARGVSDPESDPAIIARGFLSTSHAKQWIIEKKVT